MSLPLSSGIAIDTSPFLTASAAFKVAFPLYVFSKTSVLCFPYRLLRSSSLVSHQGLLSMLRNHRLYFFPRQSRLSLSSRVPPLSPSPLSSLTQCFSRLFFDFPCSFCFPFLVISTLLLGSKPLDSLAALPSASQNVLPKKGGPQDIKVAKCSLAKALDCLTVISVVSDQPLSVCAGRRMRANQHDFRLLPRRTCMGRPTTTRPKLSRKVCKYENDDPLVDCWSIRTMVCVRRLLA
jgi:hypothetical protein